MGIKRYTATQDNTITNAFESNLTTRGTGSNMGLADSLEVFSIYAQANSSSNEQTRTLIQFPVLSSDVKTTNSPYSIQADRTAGKIPASGSVSFYLRVFNVAHNQTLPKDFTLVVSPVSQSWEEGSGLDMENYSDLTYGGTGSNWINASAHSPWINIANVANVTQSGGSYLSASWMGAEATTYDEFNYKQSFTDGTKDVEVEITGLVEKWIAGDYSNYGIGLMLTSSQASGSRSYYTKKYSARESEYFFKRPIIEARWNNSRKDQRGSFYVSSSNLSTADNLNALYLYNYVRGQPTNLANVGTKPINVRIYTSASGGEVIAAVGSSSFTYTTAVTGGWVATGIYSASFALDTTASLVYDRWFSGSAGSGIDDAATVVYHTGSFKPQKFDSSNIYSIPRYVTTITNLQSEYWNDDATRLRLFTRLKDWSPTIYSVASKEIENDLIEDAYYKVYREIDELDVISYGTGSDKHTRLSYDVSGSYFDLEMSLLEKDYSYGIKFLYYINGAYEEQPEVFKFRVKE